MIEPPFKPGEVVRCGKNSQCFVVKTVWKSVRKRAVPSPGRVFITGGRTEDIWMAEVSTFRSRGADVVTHTWRCETSFLRLVHPLEALALQAE